MNSMTIPDEAVEAAGSSIYETLEDMRFHPVTDTARAALSAAMPHLHPTISNTVEALEALPVGVVLRTVDEDGDVWVASRFRREWWDLGSGQDLLSTEGMANWADEGGPSAWTVLWPLGGAV